jgi:hypothetical protein
MHNKIRTSGIDHCAFGHNIRIRHITVGEHYLVNGMRMYQVNKFVFREYGNAVGIQVACQCGRICPALNIRYLGGSEGFHVVGRIVPETYIEIVEIPACRPHYYDFS